MRDLSIRGATIHVPSNVPPNLGVLEVLASDWTSGVATLPVNEAARRSITKWMEVLRGRDAPSAATQLQPALKLLSDSPAEWMATVSLDIALVDLCARAVGTPLHQWLGGSARDSVPVGIEVEPADVLSAASGGLYHAIACRTSADFLEPAIAVLERAREAHGSALRLRLVVDGGDVAPVPKRLDQRVDALHLELIEERGGGGGIRFAGTTPVCRQLGPDVLADAPAELRDGALQVLAVEPELMGVTQVARLAALCRAFQVELLLVVRDHPVVSPVLALHLAAALPAATKGVQWRRSPREPPPVAIAKGFAAVPSDAGCWETSWRDGLIPPRARTSA